MDRNTLQRTRRQKQLRQSQQIQTLKLQLKILRQNYIKSQRKIQELEQLTTQFITQKKEKQKLQIQTRYQIRKEIQDQFNKRIQEAELKAIKVQEEYQKEIDKLEIKFKEDLDIQFKRQEGLYDVIKDREKEIEKLQDEVFQLNQIIIKKDTKIEQLSFIKAEYESIVRNLKQQNTRISLDIKKYDGQIQLLNLQITRLNDMISLREVQRNQAEQELVNRSNELKYVSLVCGENNQIKHVLLNQNDSLLNVANIMNKDLHRNKMKEYQITRQLIERTEQLNRKDMDMHSLKYQVSQLPYKI